MTNLTIHCPKCKHRHEVACESVWDERGLLVAYDMYLFEKYVHDIEAWGKNKDYDDADTFLKEREG